MRQASLLALLPLSLSLLASVAGCSSDPETSSLSKKDGGVTEEEDARRPYPSFRDDVAPIVRSSCALTACHSSKQSNLGIYLTYDATQIYAELQKTSPTSGMKFVTAGDPTKSYVMLKVDGKQGDVTTCASGCGAEMPPGDLLPTDKRDTLRKWISEGAKDN